MDSFLLGKNQGPETPRKSDPGVKSAIETPLSGITGKDLQRAMTLIFVVLFSIVLLLFLIYFIKKRAEDATVQSAVVRYGRSAVPLPGGTEPVQTLSRGPSFPVLVEGKITLPEDGISAIHRMISGRIQRGIEAVYPPSYGSPYLRALPLDARSISPETMRAVRDCLSRLKNFRSVHERLQGLLNDPKVQISDLSKVVTSDPMLTATILRIVNSPYYGLSKRIDSISHALLILGIVNVKNILYREGLIQLLLTDNPEINKAMEKIWRHAALTSICAAHLHPLFGGLNQGSLFTMGLLHDIGKLLLLMMPISAGNDLTAPHPAGLKLDDEDQLFGVNHAVVAGIALSGWGFSDLMVNAVANHHAPTYKSLASLKMDRAQTPYLFVLFIADQMAKSIAAEEDLTIEALHPSYHSVVAREHLQELLEDKVFLSRIREAEALAAPLSDDRLNSSTGLCREKVAGTQRGLLSFGSAGLLTRKEDATVILSSSAADSTIGRYQILGLLGQGSMGVVYQGRDPLIQRTVAIKTLRYAEGNDLALSRSRFFREAEAAGGLSHPNIVTIYDVGEDRGNAYIAMEYLEGYDLSRCCAKKALLPQRETIRIVREVALALDYAHRRGVVHRDVKPANIRISSAGQVTVTDFGIARLVDLSGTQAGTILGTPNYMSPEQINGEAVDGRSDLFSLGVVLYELLTGEKPFQGDDITALMNRISGSEPTPLQVKVPGIPEELAAIVEKALRKKREERYSSGQELADDLGALAQA